MDAEDYLEPEELAPRPPPAIDPDTLAYKEACDGCATHLSWVDACHVCTSECTWCPECAAGYGYVCPNCSGGLVRRPRRTRAVGR